MIRWVDEYGLFHLFKEVEARSMEELLSDSYRCRFYVKLIQDVGTPDDIITCLDCVLARHTQSTEQP